MENLNPLQPTKNLENSIDVWNLGYLSKACIFVFIFCLRLIAFAQPVPGKDENIPYLITFGKQGETKWGDDDFSQSWFFIIPKERKEPFYIRVFDPDCGGELDELEDNEFNTGTKFSIFAGKGAYSDPDASQHDPVGNYKSGTLLSSKVFKSQPEYDNNWYTFGPFNPAEGEFIKEFNGYIFKVVADGLSGDDGNIYKYFLSSSPTENLSIEGGNVFTYEYTFRLFEKPGSISHIYPYVGEDVVAINIHIFDLDDDAFMRLVSVAKKGEKITGSKENEWSKSYHVIQEEEKKTSLDIQIIKANKKPKNNVVIRITNQYGKTMPFYSVPIGGVPRYKFSIGVR